MARKKRTEEPAERLETVEALAERLRLPAWQTAGLRMRMRWAAGKQVTETVFRAALKAWLNGPMA